MATELNKRAAHLLAHPLELDAFVKAAEANADDWFALNRMARVLADFAKTAPGRLPSQVQEALAYVALVGESNAGGEVDRG